MCSRQPFRIRIRTNQVREGEKERPTPFPGHTGRRQGLPGRSLAGGAGEVPRLIMPVPLLQPRGWGSASPPPARRGLCVCDTHCVWGVGECQARGRQRDSPPPRPRPCPRPHRRARLPAMAVAGLSARLAGPGRGAPRPPPRPRPPPSAPFLRGTALPGPPPPPALPPPTGVLRTLCHASPGIATACQLSPGGPGTCLGQPQLCRCQAECVGVGVRPPGAGAQVPRRGAWRSGPRPSASSPSRTPCSGSGWRRSSACTTKRASRLWRPGVGRWVGLGKGWPPPRSGSASRGHADRHHHNGSAQVLKALADFKGKAESEEALAPGGGDDVGSVQRSRQGRSQGRGQEEHSQPKKVQAVCCKEEVADQLWAVYASTCELSGGCA